MLTRRILNSALTVIVVFSLMFGTTIQVQAEPAPIQPAAPETSSMPMSSVDESKVPHYYGPYPNWANSPQVVQDATVTITPAQPVPVSVGNPLTARTTETDLEAVFVINTSAALPDGTLSAFETWAQGAAGPQTFNAFVLRPTAGVPDNYTVVYDSGLLTVPDLASGLQTFTLPSPFTVLAGDLIAFYGQGIPSDAGSGMDTVLTGASAPSLNQTFTVGTEYTLVSADRTYSFAATVTPVSVDPGAGAEAVATVDPKTGSISGVTVINPGSGYLVAPDVVISSLNGSGAIATATISLGALTEVVVDLPGYGFTNPSVSFTGGNPSTPATAVASGGVDDVFLTAAGSGYVQPIVEFGLPDYGTDQATGAVTWDTATGTITSITVVNPGSGYASAPVVNIWDGSTGQGPVGIDGVESTAAAAGATIGISGVNLIDAGAGYDSAPTIAITDQGGVDKGADAHAVLAIRGAVTEITVNNGGTGYLTPGLKKFTDALPGLCAPPGCPSDPEAQYIPIGVPDTTTYPGSDYYEIAVVQYRHQYSSQLPPALARGYVQLETPANAAISQHYPLVNEMLDGTSVPVMLNGQQVYGVTPPKYLGPTLVTAEDWPVRILFRNLLPTGVAGDLFLPVDTSMMGSGEGPDTMMLNPDGTPMDMVMDEGSVMDGVRNQMCGETPKPTDESGKIECYTENRATLHLHGGITPWISDGTPHQWTTPANENTLYPEGVSVSNVPDMPEPGPGALTFFYTNQQSARLMFYHDHAWGITRLNVYAGEAAGYIITDDTEASLINRNLIPGPADTVPLVIQDRTFVPSAEKMAELDPTWDASRWGGLGSVWLPHVYMPAQNPSDPSGMSAFGRWMYGPYFWPPVDAKYPPIPNPYFGKDPEGPDGIRHTADDWSSNLAVPCTLDDSTTWQYDTDPFCEPPLIPGTPNNSAGMEAFHDTPVVNGVAYPTVTVDPKAYRFRILNAANDRFWNLSLYVADPRTGTLSEVALNPAELAAAQTDPVVFPTPDETWSPKGPNWIQIGTEGGFLPSPVVIPAHPTTWITDPTRFDVGLVDQHSLLIAPAERADVIVDFSQFRGKTLILYNDAPAAFPARVPGYDYYTGGPDLSPAGAPTTLPGYGPNTRTVMQIKVSSAAPQIAFDRPGTSSDRLGQLVSAFGHQSDGSGVFESGQNPIIVGQGVYNPAYGTNFASSGWCSAPANPSAKCDGYARISEQGGDLFKFDTLNGTQLAIPLEPKGIHDEMNSANFDPWGRMAGNLGLEAPGATPLLQNIILYPYTNPATEILDSTNMPSSLQVTPIASADDGTQIWKITHNGVDTHPIHFHLYDVQVLNRVAWDNIISPPDPNELGWKDTVRINPLQDTYVAVRPIVPEIPFGIPESERPLNPMMPIGARGTQNGQNGWRGTEAGFNNTDANGQAIAPIINEVVNFGWEYVWHCHILNHEEMDMMRPVKVIVNTTLPAAPTLSVTGKAGEPVTLTWTDGTAIDYNNPSTWDVTNSEIGFRVERSENGGAYAPIGNALANQTSFTDSTTSAGSSYRYLVIAYNAAGESASDIVRVGVTSPTNLVTTAQAGPQIVLQWTDNSDNETGFVVERADNGGAFTAIHTTLADIEVYTDTAIATGSTYAYRVKAVNLDEESLYTNTASTAPLPGALSKTAPTSGANAKSPIATVLSWAASTGAISYEYCIDEIDNNTCDGAWVSTGDQRTVTPALAFGKTYYWQARAVNTGGSTEADSGIWWSFSTRAGNLNKSAPANTTIDVSLDPTLSWSTSLGASSYEYCIDATAGSTCDTAWVSTGTNTSVALSGLTGNTTYYWNVRSVYAGAYTYANGNSWWSFTTTTGLPGVFNKSAPANTAIGMSPTGTTLSWAASTGAASYEYCIDEIDNNACDGAWVSTGTNQTVIPSLSFGKTYYWQVRAVNVNGSIEANNGTWWTYSTRAGNVNKSLPANGATNVSLALNLTWSTSLGASSYEYCIDTTAGPTCDTAWVSAGTNTSVKPTGLVGNTTYYWHVRSVYAGAYTYANGNSWWSFTTTANPPASFGKLSPADTAIGMSPIGTTLTWAASTGATSYEYCIDEIDNNACDGAWVSTGTNRTATPSLSFGKTYYWQVRAVNANGSIEANNGTWRSYSTRTGNVNKLAPANGATNVSLAPTLSWSTSLGAGSYEYCIDTTAGSTCDTAWVSTGTNTNVVLSGLTTNTTYYWHVRSVYAGAYTYANGNSWWSFTTTP